MALPQDPFIMLSMLNMKLRDSYPSLDALCDDLGESKQDIIDKMSAVGFAYIESENQFK